MSRFRLLITKKISRSHIINSGLNGIEIMEKEFIKISPVSSQELNEKMETLLSSKITAAFTSKNAVSIIGAAVNSDKNSFPDWKIYCLDGTTREEAEKRFSNNNIAGTARNARSLASEIINGSIEKKIIFFCGNKRRDDLPEILRNNGFEIEELVVYETELSPVKIVDHFDAIAFFSPSAAESFFSVNELDKKIVCFSVGETTTAAIKKYTGNRVITSDKPLEENLIKSVLKYKEGSER